MSLFHSLVTSAIVRWQEELNEDDCLDSHGHRIQRLNCIGDRKDMTSCETHLTDKCIEMKDEQYWNCEL